MGSLAGAATYILLKYKILINRFFIMTDTIQSSSATDSSEVVQEKTLSIN